MWEKFVNFILSMLPHIIGAIIILIVGLLVTKLVIKIMSGALKKSKLDITAHSFIKSLVKSALYAVIIVSVLTVLGVPTTSLVAIIGAAGLAVGLALQSSISNLAGGFIVLFSKPFKIGDYIEFSGVEGVVEDISILNTKLLTLDNKAVFIPNGQISSSTLINYNNQETRRLDLVFSISYKNDYKKAKEILNEVVNGNPLTLHEPEPIIRVTAHGASAIEIAVKVWVKAENYWDLHFDLNEDVKTAFDENGISIPYNQLDVFIKQ